VTTSGRLPSTLVAGLGRLARPAQDLDEHCDLCGTALDPEHRHLLEVQERQILCACEVCIAMKAGMEGLRPVGTRTLWLGDLDFPDELWAAFGLPIGLAFFLRSSATQGVVALYPSPAGATESELDLHAWEQLLSRNPVLRGLEADAEALVVNRMGDVAQHAIVPIDECYRLVGLIKATWQGISGGTAIEDAVPGFFAEVRQRAVAQA
jgi:hypothetical protein